MMYKECSKCIHNAVCKTAESCDGYVSGCEHFNQWWIPVTERLPMEEWEHFTEEYDWNVYPCLAVVKTGRRGRYVTKMFYTGENFVNNECVRYTAQVTHWMPLLQPPKGE